MTEYVSPWRDQETNDLGALASKFLSRSVLPRREEFDKQQYVDRSVWTEAGALGLMSRQVVQPADGCAADGGVDPVVIVEVDPAWQGRASRGS